MGKEIIPSTEELYKQIMDNQRKHIVDIIISAHNNGKNHTKVSREVLQPWLIEELRDKGYTVGVQIGYYNGLLTIAW